MSVAVRRTGLGIIVLVVLAALVYAFIPQPVPVDVATAARTSMMVTVEEEGVTRIRERYSVSAPLAGRLRRITLDPGDRVEADVTTLAVIEPTDPNLLDARALAGAEARVRAAEAALQQANANLQRAKSSFDLAEDSLTRVRDAHDRNAATPHELEDRTSLHRIAMEAHRAATFAEDIARYELEIARSALMHTATDGGDVGVQFRVTAPISGAVLRVFQESVAVVAPGTPLLEVGDPTDLEIVIDVLSTDAVRIVPGTEVLIERWGGAAPLRATVRLVEPSAFTKVSALGVEEQRVNVIADFTSPIDERPTLGDAYRVEAKIITWRGEDVLTVPTSALFRQDGTWSVFVTEDGRASMRPVEIGHLNGVQAEVRAGLNADDAVIAHPSDRVVDGARVEAR